MANDGTGSFVSDKGLILTNFHVVNSALQRCSTVSSNFLRDGFYAKNLSEEIPAIGYNAQVVVDYLDVTDEIEDAIKPAKIPKRGWIS